MIAFYPILLLLIANGNSICFSSHNYLFQKDSINNVCTIKSDFTNTPNYYKIDFVCDKSLNVEDFSPYSYSFPENAQPMLWISGKEYHLNDHRFINTGEPVGIISFWDGNEAMCNIKRFTLGSDTVTLYKGTFFCFGRNCNSYALIAHNSRNQKIYCFNFDGHLQFESLSVKHFKKGNKLLLRGEGKNKAGKYKKVNYDIAE